MTTADKYLSVEDVARMLGVNYQLIYRQVRSGSLPAAKIGRVYRVAKADLEEYLRLSKERVASGVVCSACGKSYASGLSVSEECSECGSGICRDCWTRLGVRKCKTHTGNK